MWNNKYQDQFGLDRVDRLPTSTKPNQVILLNEPKVYIMPEAAKTLRAFIDLCSDEISGLGCVTRLGTFEFLITDLFILDQQVSMASTDLYKKAIAQFMMDRIQSGKDLEDIKLWWHSHVNMETFWSGTDVSTATGFANGWMLSIVGNKHKRFLVRLDIYEPFPVLIDNIPLEIYFDDKDPQIIARCSQEIKKKVRPGRGFWDGFRTYPGQSFEELEGVGGQTKVPVKPINGSVTRTDPLDSLKSRPTTNPVEVPPLEISPPPQVEPLQISPAPVVSPAPVTPAPSEVTESVQKNNVPAGNIPADNLIKDPQDKKGKPV
jgi:hypothetical protein